MTLRISILGHASVLIEAGEHRPTRVVIDPVFAQTIGSETLRFYPARELDAAEITRDIAALVVTHAHLDHFHPATLAHFSRRTPLLLPPDEWLLAQARQLGFETIVPLGAFHHYALPDLRLTITPSEFEAPELGLVAESGASSYWHMSDAIVAREVGAQLRRQLGPLSLVSVKFQPIRTVIGHQRGLSALVLDRDELVEGFEAACAAEPSAIFPYSFGFAFNGEHSWANRHLGPYSAPEVSRLLARRLQGASAVMTVEPGDLLEIEGRKVSQRRGAARGVTPLSAPAPEAWEPIDASTLLGLPDRAARARLRAQLDRLLTHGVFPWIAAHRARATGLFDAYHQYQAVWQSAIHLGGDARVHCAVDFRPGTPLFYINQPHPEANVFTHVSGGCLSRILEREAGAELLWMAGGYRQYEKLLFVKDGRIEAPPIGGWELLERLPDPLCHYLRKMGCGGLTPSVAGSESEARREAALG
jgi:hypothetical protein